MSGALGVVIAVTDVSAWARMLGRASTGMWGTRKVSTSPDLSSELMAGAEWQLAPFIAAILASGYDNGPAAGPGSRGFHRPRGLSFLGRRDGLRCSGGLRERVDALPRGGDRLGPRPGRLNFEAPFPAAADQAGRGVKHAGEQRLGVGFGQVAVQGQGLGPGEQE